LEVFKMKRCSIIVGIMALVLLVSVLVGASDVVSAQGHRGGHHGKGFWSNLTEEQREAVQEKKEEMRSQGATREEIHSAVAEMLKGYGIEVPEDWHGPKGFGHGKAGFKANLTDEQREAIREKKEEMRSQGATREEIHAAVAEMLKGYGIDVPEGWRGPRGAGGFWADLTDEQREAIREKIKEMRGQDASREEIHAAVAEMLKVFGIALPEQCKGPHGPGGFWADLTDEQRDAVRDKIEEMQSQDATREEIRDAVAEMLKGYGIELPEKWREGHRGDHRHRCGLTKEQREIIRNLADEQRRTVRKTIREMRRQDATCEEIREAVAEMLEGFGIESPGDSESSSSEKASGEPYIQTQSYPNPFNPETEIAYTLSVPEIVQIQIYNVAGQVVRTFDMGYQPAGSYSVRWDGCTENGDPAASGVYLYRIEAGPHDVTNRMVLLK